MKLNVRQAALVYAILRSAGYRKLEDSDKLKVWRVFRQLKPVSEQYEEAAKDAADRLKPTEDYDSLLARAQAYESKRKDGEEDLPMTAEEYRQFVVDFNRYNKLLRDALEDLSSKEIDVAVSPLTEDTFGKLISSNDFTFEQVSCLYDLFCGEE